MFRDCLDITVQRFSYFFQGYARPPGHQLQNRESPVIRRPFKIALKLFYRLPCAFVHIFNIQHSNILENIGMLFLFYFLCTAHRRSPILLIFAPASFVQLKTPTEVKIASFSSPLNLFFPMSFISISSAFWWVIDFFNPINLF